MIASPLLHALIKRQILDLARAFIDIACTREPGI